MGYTVLSTTKRQWGAHLHLPAAPSALPKTLRNHDSGQLSKIVSISERPVSRLQTRERIGDWEARHCAWASGHTWHVVDRKVLSQAPIRQAQKRAASERGHYLQLKDTRCIRLRWQLQGVCGARKRIA